MYTAIKPVWHTAVLCDCWLFWDIIGSLHEVFFLWYIISSVHEVLLFWDIISPLHEVSGHEVFGLLMCLGCLSHFLHLVLVVSDVLLQYLTYTSTTSNNGNNKNQFSYKNQTINRKSLNMSIRPAYWHIFISSTPIPYATSDKESCNMQFSIYRKKINDCL